jgi:hypothetical protein
MTIGVISEGNTDHLVIRTIIDTLINHEQQDKALISKLCPMDKEPSGYPKVLNYIQSSTFKEAFKSADFYAVIHLDTDAKTDWYGEFKHREDVLEMLKGIVAVSGADKGKVSDIVANIEQLIRLIIGPAFYDANKDKIILAIAVNEIECWVLPYHATTKSDLGKMVNCLTSLNKILAKQGYTIASNGKATNNFKFYRKAIDDLSNRKVLLDKYHHNESLKIFVEKLLPFA